MEATPEQSAEGLAIVRVLSAVLDRLVAANATTARADPGQVTKFHAMKAPGIGIQQYLERIQKYASCSNGCFILALIYIDRLIQRNNFLLTELNVHRVVITAVLLAAKFFDDAYYNNAYYAKVGGVLVSEMNGLEVDFLFRINFSLHVAPDVFQKYRAQLLSQVAPAENFVPTHSSPIHHPAAPQRQVSAPSATPYADYVAMIQGNSCRDHNMMASQIHTAPQRQLPAPTPAMQYADYIAMMQNNSCRDHTSRITPSPPRTEAGRFVDDLVYHQNNGDVVMTPAKIDMFLQPLHRTNSEPVSKTNYCSPGLPRRSQKSFSAPPLANPGALRYPGDDSFVAMDHHIYPIQSTLVHHQHGDFASHNAPDLVSGRMLTGLSGAGF